MRYSIKEYSGKELVRIIECCGLREIIKEIKKTGIEAPSATIIKSRLKSETTVKLYADYVECWYEIKETKEKAEEKKIYVYCVPFELTSVKKLDYEYREVKINSYISRCEGEDVLIYKGSFNKEEEWLKLCTINDIEESIATTGGFHWRIYSYEYIDGTEAKEWLNKQIKKAKIAWLKTTRDTLGQDFCIDFSELYQKDIRGGYSIISLASKIWRYKKENGYFPNFHEKKEVEEMHRLYEEYGDYKWNNIETNVYLVEGIVFGNYKTALEAVNGDSSKIEKRRIIV